LEKSTSYEAPHYAVLDNNNNNNNKKKKKKKKKNRDVLNLIGAENNQNGSTFCLTYLIDKYYKWFLF
jgi:hypothetical protein